MSEAKQVKYDSLYACPKCGGCHEVEPKAYINASVCEANTVCHVCGYVGFWAYGFFAPDQP